MEILKNLVDSKRKIRSSERNIMQAANDASVLSCFVRIEKFSFIYCESRCGSHGSACGLVHFNMLALASRSRSYFFWVSDRPF